MFISPSLVFADQAQYIYDDLGRLSQGIDGQGNVATYTYDAVGNLLSITRNTIGVGAPTITAFTPNSGNAGDTVNVSLTGTGFATGTTLKIGNKSASVLTLVSATSMIVQVQVSGVRTGTGTGGAGASPQGAIEVSLPEASKMMPIGD